MLGNLLVTDLPWTAVNLSRYHRLHDALIPLDSALRIGASRDDLMLCAEEMKGWKGTKLVGEAICLAADESESPLESYARGRFIEEGIPSPVLQHPAGVPGRSFRADFAWPQHRVIVETDGKEKYSASGAYGDEKERERLLQQAGWLVLRCGWDELVQRDSRFLWNLKRTLLATRRSA
jgi:very-short-patch-repair endonuclease